MQNQLVEEKGPLIFLGGARSPQKAGMAEEKRILPGVVSLLAQGRTDVVKQQVWGICWSRKEGQVLFITHHRGACTRHCLLWAPDAYCKMKKGFSILGTVIKAHKVLGNDFYSIIDLCN